MLNTEVITLSGAPVEIAEYKDYRLATFLISVLGEYDLNRRMIPVESGKAYHNTIVGFPIVAKIICDADGNPADFAGHEMYVTIDPDGSKHVKFGTIPIGSVLNSWIEEREVQGYHGKKECIMIQAKLWSSRFPEYFKVLDKLWSENNVKSSWELTVEEAEQTPLGRVLKVFSFIGNALLGSDVMGAVPGAGVYEYAEASDPELELACALAKDMSMEGDNMKDDMTPNVAQGGGASDPSANVQENVVSTYNDTNNSEPEVTTQIDEGSQENSQVQTGGETDVGQNPEHTEECASLTDNDIRKQIEDAYRATYRKWCYVSFLFPADSVAWLTTEDKDNELDFTLVNYQVTDNEVELIGDPELVHLTVSVSELNKTINEKNDALLKASAKIQDLQNQVSELMPYKESADAAERERIEAETAEKRNALKDTMLKSNLFTEDEINSSELLQNIIMSLDESALKEEIATRFMATLRDQNTERTTESASFTNTQEARVSMKQEADVTNEMFMRTLLNT